MKKEHHPVEDKSFAMSRICVQWPRFGPYHLARLRAVHAFLSALHVDLVALETAGHEARYGWYALEHDASFQHEQVFPNQVFESIAPRDMYAKVTATLDRLQPDAIAINSYSHADAQACLAWCRRHRRVAVVITDSKADDGPRAAWREALKGILIRQFDAAFVAGQPQLAYMESFGFPPQHIVTGCDVVDNSFFHEQAEVARLHPEAYAHLPGLDTRSPFFLTVGRFIPIKNLEHLLRAYRSYRQQTAAPWRLMLVGDGPLRSRLESIIEQHGIEGVTLTGFLQPEDIAVYYGLAKALVHPTLADTWGLVINEAMAAGLPVLVSNAAGCAQDLVDDGKNGFRFDPHDEARLAALMRRMTAPDTDLKAMENRSREIIARYTPEHFARQLWAAVQAGRSRSHRGLHPAARAMLFGLRLPSRLDAFHTLEG